MWYIIQIVVLNKLWINYNIIVKTKGSLLVSLSQGSKSLRTPLDHCCVQYTLLCANMAVNIYGFQQLYYCIFAVNSQILSLNAYMILTNALILLQGIINTEGKCG